VEVYCDHEKNKERIRGWIHGIVVQVDNKMVAVQFRSNVFLTDGWMVPDRILWYPLELGAYPFCCQEVGQTRKGHPGLLVAYRYAGKLMFTCISVYVLYLSMLNVNVRT
jgi:hypothetical protein